MTFVAIVENITLRKPLTSNERGEMRAHFHLEALGFLLTNSRQIFIFRDFLFRAIGTNATRRN